jgi:hypothetical protein
MKDYLTRNLSAGSKVRGQEKARGDALVRMFRLLAVCHTVVVETNPKTGALTY